MKRRYMLGRCVSQATIGLRAVGLCLGLLAATGCVTEGRDFPTDISWIKLNETSKKDVKLVLGDPRSVGQSSGSPTWTFGYYQYRVVGTSHTKELRIFWNPDGTVKNFTFDSNFPDDVRQRAANGTANRPQG